MVLWLWNGEKPSTAHYAISTLNVWKFPVDLLEDAELCWSLFFAVPCKLQWEVYIILCDVYITDPSLNSSSHWFFVSSCFCHYLCFSLVACGFSLLLAFPLSPIFCKLYIDIFLLFFTLKNTLASFSYLRLSCNDSMTLAYFQRYIFIDNIEPMLQNTASKAKYPASSLSMWAGWWQGLAGLSCFVWRHRLRQLCKAKGRINNIFVEADETF